MGEKEKCSTGCWINLTVQLVVDGWAFAGSMEDAVVVKVVAAAAAARKAKTSIAIDHDRLRRSYEGDDDADVLNKIF